MKDNVSKQRGRRKINVQMSNNAQSVLDYEIVNQRAQKNILWLQNRIRPYVS